MLQLARMSPHAVAALARRILDQHHTFLHAELPRLAHALEEAPRQLRAPFAHLMRVEQAHMQKEEGSLYPAILRLCEDERADADLGAAVAQMIVDHDEVRTLEDAMRNAARDAGPLELDLLALLDDLVEHHRLEEEELFPAVLALVKALPVDAPPPAKEKPRKLRSRGRPPEPKGAPAAEPEPPGRVMRETRGVCPTCHQQVPAALVVRDGAALLEKTCPTHGRSSQLMSRRADYWAELDKFYFSVNEESYPQRDFIVRMTERCNLACPICLAKANTEDTPDFDLAGLGELLSERRGIKIDLMAAEPTLREDLEDWIRKVKATGNIAALHTNGLKLANMEYARKIKEAGVDEVFLQFDGMDDAANKALRGRPLLKARQAALANLRELGIATSLIVVVARELNEDQVGETFRFALKPENDHIREVFFLGLRLMGSARHAGTFGDQQIMPDELIDLLCAQEPKITRKDVHAFNMLYFTMLSAFKVKKCLYVQHYLVSREAGGGYRPASEIFDLAALQRAAVRYAARHKSHPALARAGLAASLVKQGIRPNVLRIAGDLLRLEQLFEKGMNLGQVPPRFLIIGFITACDPYNFDSQVAINCGKGEVSADGGFTESSAVANVRREARFEETARTPGKPFQAPKGPT
ncbi:MAG: radical SAM protein [Myxococcota bacterium]